MFGKTIFVCKLIYNTLPRTMQWISAPATLSGSASVEETRFVAMGRRRASSNERRSQAAATGEYQTSSGSDDRLNLHNLSGRYTPPPLRYGAKSVSHSIAWLYRFITEFKKSVKLLDYLTPSQPLQLVS